MTQEFGAPIAVAPATPNFSVDCSRRSVTPAGIVGVGDPGRDRDTEAAEEMFNHLRSRA